MSQLKSTDSLLISDSCEQDSGKKIVSVLSLRLFTFFKELFYVYGWVLGI